MKIHTDWIGVLFGILISISVAFLVFMLTLLLLSAYDYDHPKTYGDTIEYLMRSIQNAKNEAIRLGDQERFEYWSNLEKELSDKAMEESMKGDQQ